MVYPIDRAEALPYVILPFQGSLTSAFSPLFVLIHPPVLFCQRQQFLKLPQPRLRQLPRIHLFPVRLEPVEHIMLFQPVFRRIPLIGLNELLHLIISNSPWIFFISSR